MSTVVTVMVMTVANSLSADCRCCCCHNRRRCCRRRCRHLHSPPHPSEQTWLFVALSTLEIAHPTPLAPTRNPRGNNQARRTAQWGADRHSREERQSQSVWQRAASADRTTRSHQYHHWNQHHGGEAPHRLSYWCPCCCCRCCCRCCQSRCR